MASKPETTFIASVHKHLCPAVYFMKNHNEYVGGVADVWYSGHVGDLWIEYKFVILPKRGNTMIVPDLSTLQVAWCRNRFEEGRDVNVVVGCKDGGVVFDSPYDWEHGLSTEAFVRQLQSRKQLASYIESRTI